VYSTHEDIHTNMGTASTSTLSFRVGQAHTHIRWPFRHGHTVKVQYLHTVHYAPMVESRLACRHVRALRVVHFSEHDRLGCKNE